MFIPPSPFPYNPLLPSSDLDSSTSPMLYFPLSPFHPNLLTSSPHPSPLCSSYLRWSHQMMILSASAPVPVSHPSGASVQGGHCLRAIQDSWDRLEIHCHGTCPNMRGGRGRVKTQCWTQQRGQWFVLQVKADDFLFLQSTKDSLNRWRQIDMEGVQSSTLRNFEFEDYCCLRSRSHKALRNVCKLLSLFGVSCIVFACHRPCWIMSDTDLMHTLVDLPLLFRNYIQDIFMT